MSKIRSEMTFVRISGVETHTGLPGVAKTGKMDRVAKVMASFQIPAHYDTQSGKSVFYRPKHCFKRLKHFACSTFVL